MKRSSAEQSVNLCLVSFQENVVKHTATTVFTINAKMALRATAIRPGIRAHASRDIQANIARRISTNVCLIHVSMATAPTSLMVIIAFVKMVTRARIAAKM